MHTMLILQELKDSITDETLPLAKQFLGAKKEVIVTSMHSAQMRSNSAIVSPCVDLLPIAATAVLNIVRKVTYENEDA